MQIEMIVVDLDGTVLHNDESLTNDTINTLKRYQNIGVKIVIATSRSESSARKYSDLIKPDAIILSSGSKAYVGNNVVYEAQISPVLAEEYIKKCLKTKAVEYLRISGEYEDFTNNPNVTFGKMEFGHYKKTTFESIYLQPVDKITIFSKKPKEIIRMFENDDRCVLHMSYAGQYYHKLTHKKATKEHALKNVLSYFKISSSKVIAFGDDTPDANMLIMCGIGVAVKNAKCNIKMIADEICDENEIDGVANYLNKNFENLCY